MSKIFFSLKSLIGSKDQTNVPFSILLHDDKKYHIVEGSGAMPVEQWTIYKFYKNYAAGKHEKAVNDFTDWYLQQFYKYSHIEKRYGGMFEGSLYHLIIKIQAEHNLDAREDPAWLEKKVIKDAVSSFVIERLKLLDSIKAKGYLTQNMVKIIGVKKKKYIFIRNGHHRIVVLKALGFSQVPLILVYPNELIYSFAKSKWLKKSWKKISSIIKK